MKKLVKLFILFILFIQLIGCKQSEDKGITYPIIYDYLDSITMDSFDSRLINQESFIVYVSRPSCGDCEILDKRLINDIENNDYLKKILYLNITPIYSNKDEWNKFKNNYGIKGTPAFIFIDQGKIRDSYGWTEENGFDYEKFINWVNKIKN